MNEGLLFVGMDIVKQLEREIKELKTSEIYSEYFESEDFRRGVDFTASVLGVLLESVREVGEVVVDLPVEGIEEFDYEDLEEIVDRLDLE